MSVFNPAHVRNRDLDMQLHQRSELAAIASGQTDGFAAYGIRVFDGVQTFGELPEPLIPITTSPGCAKFFNCSAKTAP